MNGAHVVKPSPSLSLRRHTSRSSGSNASEASPLLENSVDASEITVPLGEEMNDGHNSGSDIEEDWAGIPKWRRPSIFWLVIPFCLFTTAFGSIAVPRLNVIVALVCRNYFADKDVTVLPIVVGGDGSDNRQCQIPEVQALASKFSTYMSLIAGILGAITSPRLGQLSDRYGRKFFMGLSSLGLLTSELCTVLAVWYPETFHMNILLVASTLDGLCGSFLLGQAVAASYAADCTRPAERAVAFGYFQGALYLGIAIGPLLGSLIIKATGDVLNVFYAAMTASLTFIIYVVFVLPESLSKKRQLHAREVHLAKYPLGARGSLVTRVKRNANILAPLRVLFPRGSSVLRRNMLLLAGVDAIIFGVGMGSLTVITLYVELTFDWGSVETGFFLSIVNSTRVTLLFVLVPVLAKCIRGNDIPGRTHRGADKLDVFLIRFAVFTEFLGYSGYALSQNPVQFTASGMLVALGGGGSPTVQSALTKHVPPTQTGQLLGAIALLHSMARILSPLIFNSIYAFGVVRGFEQSVFVCLASLFCIAAVCCWGLKSGVGYVEEDSEGSLADGEGHVESTG